MNTDLLTIQVHALLLITLARIVFALLQIVHRRELALARQHERDRRLAPIRIRIDAYSPVPRQHARHRARHNDYPRGG